MIVLVGVRGGECEGDEGGREGDREKERERDTERDAGRKGRFDIVAFECRISGMFIEVCSSVSNYIGL